MIPYDSALNFEPNNNIYRWMNKRENLKTYFLNKNYTYIMNK